MTPGVHAILGHRGSGKSRLARALVAPSRKLLIVDTLGEHSGLARRVQPEALAAALAATPDAYRYGVTPCNLETVDWIERVAASRPGCCLFIDEIDFWYPDARATVGVGLSSLVRYGRHYDQTVVAIARRPADLSRTVTSQASLWCFPMREPRDRAYVAQFSSFDPADLRILETSREGYVIRTEIARTSIRGLEIGEFNLVTGQYRFGMPRTPAPVPVQGVEPEPEPEPEPRSMQNDDDGIPENQ